MLALFLLRVADKLSSRSGALPLYWGGRAPGIPRASHPQLGKHTEEDYYRPENEHAGRDVRDHDDDATRSLPPT